MVIFRLINLQLSVLVLLALSSCNTEKPPQQTDLNSGWQFKAVDSVNWINASVPGVVHTDLLEHGLIPDPFIGTFEDSVQWVEEKKWEYKTSFNITEEEQNFDKIDLVFDGLDTYAEVYLNDKAILDANNMFRQWRVGVKEDMLIGQNELRIVFTPPIEKNKAQLEQLGYTLPAGSETGKWQVSPFTRKAGYQFGWDFAPRLVTMGIWQPVRLEYWDQVRIENVRFELNNLTATKASYTIHLSIYGGADNINCKLNVEGSEQDIMINTGYNNVAIDIVIENPKLWWPNGLGEPYLYDIPIKIISGGTELASTSKKLGIRTIELVQDFDSLGRSFYFKVNSEKVFVKGANWSPLGSYPSSIPDSTYVNRLLAVKDAHMNMLRVWGGGIYESDLFYNLCDENGILVWQDFMFANSMYPGNDAFIDNAREEVRYQVTRLQSHASIAIWNGNNEIEVAWKNWGWQKQFGYTAADSSKIWSDYEHFFKQDIPQVLDVYDPARAYTSTSPLSNWGHPDNFKSGSMHYWGVWHGGDTFDEYRTKVGRFMAEYGFQSFPDIQTVSYYAGDKEFKLESALAHQKSYVGNDMISREIAKNYGNVLSFQSFLEKSQQTQALAYKIAIEAHRINKETCGGTLFWQFSDCWPGPSWSVIDYFGHKKIAYQVVKDRYKPVILVADRLKNDFSVSVVSDLLTQREASLKLELFKHDHKRLWVSEKQIAIEPNSAEIIYRSDIRKLLDGMPKQDVYLKITLIGRDEIIDVEKFYFVKPKDFKGEVDLVGSE